MINIIMLGSREKLSLFSEYHDKMNLQSKGFSFFYKCILAKRNDLGVLFHSFYDQRRVSS